MSERVKLPDSTQLDTLNGKLDTINTTLAGQGFVTAENVKSALGYPPDDDEYELIAKYDITEDCDAFAIDDLNLKKIIVAVARVPSSDGTLSGYYTNTVQVKCTDGTEVSCKTGFGSFSDSYKNYWLTSAEIKGVAMSCNTCWKQILPTQPYSGWSYGNCDTKRETNWVEKLDFGSKAPQKITRFSISAAKAITAGSTVVVYGVRVKEAST